ncbi:MYCBP-associated protein-like isoform X2 [Physella acuta]|uniref:MYCBP-associated protein-like isoform X2 n=1 Tax=Physella acuta TaxID=109671 RepID=UPI0027DBBD41|nr:MYCBP-associated protein-like isoform X2 [Physella acuta]
MSTKGSAASKLQTASLKATKMSVFNIANRLKKKRDGTPDKSTTPTQDSDDRLTPAKNVIWNEEIEKLQIKQDELIKLRPPHPPPEERKMVTRKVPVKKVKIVPEEAKPATPPKPKSPSGHNRPISPADYLGYAGPRYDEKGNVINHSLLGTYEEYHREAVRRGDLLDIMPVPKETDRRLDTPSVKYEKKKKTVKLTHDENNAINNWNQKMNERKLQQIHISKLLQKPVEDLAMNQADNYRAIQEQRYLIDRTLPKVDYGKGYRIGSEFWNQQRLLGDENNGIHMSLTQAQRGYPPPVEHVGLSQLGKAEKGCEWLGKKNSHVNYPWHKSEFLNQRLQQLQPYIQELDPWKPEFEYLQIVGSNKPYEKSMEEEKSEQDSSETDTFLESSKQETEGDSDKNQESMEDNSSGQDESLQTVFGPSLLFAGQPARWIGDSSSLKNKTAIEARVTFEGFTCDRVTSLLELHNNGTTVIYYDWKKVGKENPFAFVQNEVQRFYFNTASGVILPGESFKFPFVFKSPTPGVYTEQWKFETRPSLCGGAALLVTLRGVAIQEDKYKEQREKLEKELLERQANEAVKRILYELVNGIRTPERSRSPVDAYITEEEIFSRNNPALQYSHELVSQLKDIYSQLFDEELRAENVWSLSIADLQESVMELEDDEKRENLLQQMNLIVGKLTYIPAKPLPQQTYGIGYRILQEAIDKIVKESSHLRQTLGLPGREDDTGKDGIQTPSGANPDHLHEDNNPPPPPADDGRKKGSSKASQGKAAGKDVKTSKTPTGKTDPKGKTPPSPAPPGKKAQTPVKVTPPAQAPPQTPQAVPGTPPGGNLDPIPANGTPAVAELSPVEKLYKEIFASQVYNILGDTLDRMDVMLKAFREVNQEELESYSKHLYAH